MPTISTSKSQSHAVCNVTINIILRASKHGQAVTTAASRTPPPPLNPLPKKEKADLAIHRLEVCQNSHGTYQSTHANCGGLRTADTGSASARNS